MSALFWAFSIAIRSKIYYKRLILLVKSYNKLIKIESDNAQNFFFLNFERGASWIFLNKTKIPAVCPLGNPVELKLYKIRESLRSNILIT